MVLDEAHPHEACGKAVKFQQLSGFGFLWEFMASDFLEGFSIFTHQNGHGLGGAELGSADFDAVDRLGFAEVDGSVLWKV